MIIIYFFTDKIIFISDMLLHKMTNFEMDSLKLITYIRSQTSLTSISL